jgi:ubiquitin carboxyl-terminal hydrolase 16/45
MEQAQVMASLSEEAAGLDEPVSDSIIPPGRWFHVSDSRINEVTEATVLKAQAYLLFYERIY